MGKTKWRAVAASVLAVLATRALAAEAPAATPHTATASVTVLDPAFRIPELGRTRRVWIYLPPGYARGHKRYRVIYMQDGQNVFDAATSGFGEWGVDESLDALRGQGDPGAIVVAVDHGGEHRLDEYDPWTNSVDPKKYGGGEGDAYVDFLVHDLKPWIDARYRTCPDARHTAVMGSSMGGLISLYAALKYPEVFGEAGVFSPATWLVWDKISAYAARPHDHRFPQRFYFVSGAHESADPGGPAEDQRRLVRILATAGTPPTALSEHAPADGKHNEKFWRREFPAAYRWMFRGVGGCAAR